MQMLRISVCWLLGMSVVVDGLPAGADADRRPPERTTAELQTLVDAAIAEQAANRGRLTSAQLVWNRKTRHDGFTPGRTGETSGTYRMWFRDGKLATWSSGESFDQEGTIRESGERTVSDGKEFRVVPNVENPKKIGIAREGKVKLHGDWLKIVQWNSPTFFERIAGDQIKGFTVEKWDPASGADGERLSISYVHSSERSRVSFLINLSRGGAIEEHKAFYPSGKLQVENRAVIREVADGLWMPVEYSTSAFDEKNGMPTLSHEYSLILSECKFNEPDQIADGVFSIPIERDMRVNDRRAGATVRYTDVADVLPMDELKRLQEQKDPEPILSVIPRAARRAWLKPLFIANGTILICAGVFLWYRRRTQRMVGGQGPGPDAQ